MRLDKNTTEFIKYISDVSRVTGFNEFLIEKDYFVTLLLNEANKEIKGLVFKGGTSLSKCHKIIDRFSEDIDLSLNNDFFSQKYKRNAVKIMVNVIENLGFILLNKDKILKHTHGTYNCFEIEYPTCFNSKINKPIILLELVYIERTYPTLIKEANSYIGEFLISNNYVEVINKYELEPFKIEVQALERTFVDKVFAICDYYVLKKERRNSRHIYDIYKILGVIDISNKDLKPFIEEIRTIRKKNKNCVTAQDNVDINEILKEIVESNYYKKDYEKVTSLLVTKPISYNEIITCIPKIIESKLFEK